MTGGAKDPRHCTSSSPARPRGGRARAMADPAIRPSRAPPSLVSAPLSLPEEGTPRSSLAHSHSLTARSPSSPLSCAQRHGHHGQSSA
ncbi:hypothetical protein U9M48_031364 [Paspalum notatum var. saurae]|uniref:Uncharacterized protein n=1 Tax=Paspalum notatum var. saurae TaxID=547442 RepID=A0AAQ3U2W4_PASNO